MRSLPVSPDHHVAMAEIHRRIAPSIIPPSLNWYVALWPEPNFRAHPDIADQNAGRNDWLGRINAFVANLERTLSGGQSTGGLRLPLTDSESDLKKAKFLPLYGKSSEHYFYWKIKVEAHYEYVTISISLSVSLDPLLSEEELSDDQHSLNGWPTALSRTTPEMIHQSIESIFKRGETPDLIRVSSDIIFDKIWDRIIDSAMDGIVEDEKFGFLFSDFRSLVIDIPEQEDEKFVPNGRMDENSTKTDLLKKCSETVERFSQTYKMMIGGVRRKELVACSMLRGRYVYLSTLGARDDEKYVSEGTSNSVKFVLLGITDSDKYQLGRLLERIHTIGASRLAALKNLDRIRNIGRRVQAMGLELDRITRPQEPDLVAIENFLVRLNALGTEKQNYQSGGDDEIRDGASYRISRADFYISVVETRLQDLGIERIEKWQPYDEVLRRRLFPAYKFIGDVGERIERLRDRVNSILSMIETRNSRELLEDRNKQIASQDKLGRRIYVLTVVTVLIGTIQIGIAILM